MKDRWGEYQVCTGFEGSGKCWWCGGDFPDKRQRRYCSEKCSDEYYECFYWQWAVPAAIKRAGNKCEDCGYCPQEFHYPELLDPNPLEVHHLEPLQNEPRNFNVKNRPENLIVLCRSCHGKRHRKTYNSDQLVMGLRE